jgi:hypothetical protein
MLDQLGLFGTDNTFAGPTLADAVTIAKRAALGITEAISNFAKQLASGPIDRTMVNEVMNDAFGGTDAEGAWAIQDAYNALEGALIRVIREAPSVDIDLIESLLERLPTQTRRTSDKINFQQFSTPPSIGLIAAKLAAITPNDTVLEPSCGTGLLALFGTLAGAKVVLNEMDTTRLDIATAALSPLSAHKYDAKYLSVYNRKFAAPSVVLMNPPFSAHEGSTSAKVGLQHVAQAGMLLPPGGRLVTVLGEMQHPSANPALWSDLLSSYSLRAALFVNGREYRKMGTEFGIVVVALDKAPGLDPIIVETEPETVRELLERLPMIPRLETGTAKRYDTTLERINVTTSKTAKVYVPKFDGVVNVEYSVAPDAERAEEGIFVQYAPYLNIVGAKAHPDPLVESAALACVRPPVPTSPVLLPQRAINALSVAQLESVIYARHAHAQTVQIMDKDPDTNEDVFAEVNKGMMFGHGTGFGKGRTMAGILLSAFAEGNTKALWLSESQTLAEDAQRDIVDVWGEDHKDALFNLSDFSANVDIDRAHGIMYSTYATLRSESRQSTRSRLEQVVNWLGKDFAGVIIMDECHNLANAVESDGGRGKKNASKQAIAAVTLQRRLPKAKMVYTSATSASRLEAFLYAPRLGLWGPGTAFSTQEMFVTRLAAGGTGAMELLCRDAKSLGCYLATSLSMREVTYERLEHAMTPEQEMQYDTIAQAWLCIDSNARQVLDDTNANGMGKAAALSKLESTRLRCLQSVLVAAKLPTVIAHIEQALANDKSAVIQITNTYEAAQERALASLDDDGSLDDLDLSPKEQILEYLDKAFPVTQYVTKVVNGKEVSEPLQDEQGNPIASPEALAIREELKAKVSALLIPMSPLDILIEHFGTENVAEITGRKRRVVSKVVDGERKRVIENRNEHANSGETDAFMAGKKRILIFSRAGGTGRSYHSARTVKNQQQRYHYLLQTGWRSENEIQGLGRTHRTNQACAPHWILCTTDAPGERRFISTIARRLEELGACTRGQRDAAGTGLFSAADNLETSYGTDAVRATLMRISSNNCTEIPYETWLAETNFGLQDDRDGAAKADIADIPVSRFLNKMLASRLRFQHILMDVLLRQLEATVEAAKAAGTFDVGIETLRALRITRLGEKVIFEDDATGAKTMLVTLGCEQEAKKTSFGTVLGVIRKARKEHPHSPAYFGKDEGGNIVGVYPVAETWMDERGAARNLYKVVRPGRTEFAHTVAYERIADEDTASDLWKAEFEEIADTVTVRHYLACGTLLPIYDRLPNTMMKVYRVALEGGERLIGRRINASELAEFLGKFNEDGAVDIDTLVETLQHGHALNVSNGYKLRQVRFNDSKRIEIIVPDYRRYSDAGYLRALGAIEETVQFKLRFFVPVGQEATVLAQLLERNTIAAAA